MQNASNNETINTFKADETTGCNWNWNNMFIKDIDSMYTSSVLFCLINSLTGASAVFGNALVIIAIVKNESLHSPSNIALCCLAIADLSTGLITQPCGVISRALRIRGRYSLYCAFHEGLAFTTIMAGASCLTMSVLSMDRFLALRFHLRYPQIVTIPRILGAEFVGLLWTFSLGVVRMINAKLSTNLVAATLSINIIIFTVMNVATFRTVRSLERTIISEAQLAAHLQSRNFEIKKIKRHSWTLVIIFVQFFLSCLPYLCVSLALIIKGSNIASRSQQMANEAALTISFINASVNPVVYCFRMKEIRQAVWKIFKNNEQVAPL